jgi:prepilin peptidase CpaA
MLVALFLISFFPLLMIWAAVSDVVSLTIPNVLNATIVIVFAVVAAIVGLGGPLLGWHLAAGGGVLLLCFGLFASNVIGGGDAKMAGAVALWLGPALLLDWLLWTAVFGGVLALLILLVRSVCLPQSSPIWLARLHDKKNGLPYGVAIGGAALLVYPHSAIFDAIMKISP